MSALIALPAHQTSDVTVVSAPQYLAENLPGVRVDHKAASGWSEPNLKDGGPLIFGRLHTILSKASLQSTVWFLIAYIAVLFTIIIATLLYYLHSGHEVNQVSITAYSCMVVLHVLAVCVWILKMRNATARTSHMLRPGLTVGIVLGLDSLLFAIADPVVQHEVGHNSTASTFLQIFGSVPAVDDENVVRHPYGSNLLFQFHFVYHTLFVLRSSHACYVATACWLLYTAIVAHAYQSMTVSGHLPQEEIYAEFFMVGVMIFTVTVAKHLQEALQRPVLEQFENEALCQARSLRPRGVHLYREEVYEMVSCPGSSAAPNPVPRVVHFATGSSFPSQVHNKSLLAMNKHSTAPVGRSMAFAQMQPSACAPEQGDCLPADTLVWAENEAMPKHLGAVKANEKVLCYDNVAGMLKYCVLESIGDADVNDNKGSVTVGLEDGTVLEMTADHPMECYKSEGRGAQEGSHGPHKCVRAEDLTVGSDGVLVLQTKIVAVTSLQRNTPAAVDPAASRHWINVCVQQPQRHTIFAMQGKNKMASNHCVAVGPSNMEPSTQQTTVSNTFLNVSEAPKTSRNVGRTSSAPPKFRVQEQELTSSALRRHHLGSDCFAKSEQPSDVCCDGISDFGVNTRSTHDFTADSRDDTTTTNSRSHSRTASECEGAQFTDEATATARNRRRRAKQKEKRRIGTLDAKADSEDLDDKIEEDDRDDNQMWAVAL